MAMWTRNSGYHIIGATYRSIRVEEQVPGRPEPAQIGRDRSLKQTKGTKTARGGIY